MQPRATRDTRTATAAAWASSVGGSTRVCPNRSTSRASWDATSASVTAKAPPTRPAAAKAAVRVCTSQTMLRLIIAAPTRPSDAGRRKAAALGIRSRAR